MTTLKFLVEDNKLSGPAHIAKIKHEEKEGQFEIKYNIFTRDSFEVSFVQGKEVKKLGQYVGCLDQAKKLCQEEWSQRLTLKST